MSRQLDASSFPAGFAFAPALLTFLRCTFGPRHAGQVGVGAVGLCQPGSPSPTARSRTAAATGAPNSARTLLGDGEHSRRRSLSESELLVQRAAHNPRSFA